MKIIRGYWDCKSCGTKGIDGLVDTCPNCAIGKPEDTKYYLKEIKEEVTEEELNKAGISIEECDGNHKEWVCPYCNQLNNWADTTCQACAGAKTESKQEYGNKKILKNEEIQNEIEEIEEDVEAEYIKEFQIKNKENKINDYYFENKKSYNKSNNIKDFFLNNVSKIMTSIMISLGIVFALFLFWPIQEIATVTGFEWTRSIYIEEMRTVKEDSWSLPSNGRLLYTQEELYGYEDVFSHYETKTRQCSRQVLDGYDTYTTYEDNGNGTFTAVEHSTPKYRTEYYTETYQEPVYVSVPVYKTKYYYEIDKWFQIDSSDSHGNDKNPYWNTNYMLKSNERDIKRSENYYILFSNNDKTNASFEVWNDTKLNDEKIITKNRLGIVYSVK